MIEVSGLRKSYGSVDALRGVDLKVNKGEFLTLFGPNGAGKTTLLKILSTIIRPTSGKVLIDGLEINEAHQDIRRKIGVISHKTFLYGDLTALENLLFYARIYDLPNPEERSSELIKEVGLGGREHHLVRTFSRGMEQRLSIARAIIHEPNIIYLDEPYSGLDQHAALMLRNLLKKLHTETRTIIMTTHNILHGLEISDRIVIQLAGRIVYENLTKNHSVESFEKVYFEKVGTVE
ncbi:MAG: heme ABC exporter ATP-binding protein CcmA [Deltaproteobacteria bacterium]|nr:heme ABC exporter ATP-binding protein CcmA [Deltaproteobacteria bacterium]